MLADAVPEVSVTGELGGPPVGAAIGIEAPLASRNVAGGELGSQQEEYDLSDTVAPKYSEPSPNPGELGGETTTSLVLQGGELLGNGGVVGAGLGACSASHGTDDGSVLAAPVEGISAAPPGGREAAHAPRDVTAIAAASSLVATTVTAPPGHVRLGLMRLPRILPPVIRACGQEGCSAYAQVVRGLAPPGCCASQPDQGGAPAHVVSGLKAMLSDAERRSMIQRNPPRTGTRSSSRRGGPAPDRAARAEEFEGLYTLALTTGMLSGEIWVLHWRDVDLEGSRVRSGGR
jgi:hypothetical protein